ncbi:MAG TPA: IclR family transcriptional regulator [Candidatus Corynebacterium avicola]|uniref:IclR family transcriptional regulator n=1 Tax=Candidatus Corynebacterium avicola TaxID=2838527 RepID=A0A9D1RPS8_9CORY|nr:IclR family transcriptional regulator [Candidatus Corynebacterium avicola]
MTTPTADKTCANAKDMTSVDKAVAVLRAFRRDANNGIGVSEIARRSGLSKSTAYRILGNLEENGMVERVGTAYRFGTTLRGLGAQGTVATHDRLRNLLTPFLTELFSATGMTVQLGVLEGTQVVYLNKLEGRTRLETPSRIGGRMPTYCTGAGKVLVASNSSELEMALAVPRQRWTDTTITEESKLRAEFAQIRRTGIAYDRGECLTNLSCVAVPVTDGSGCPVASLSISGHTETFRPREVEYILRTVGEAASRTLTAATQRQTA